MRLSVLIILFIIETATAQVLPMLSDTRRTAAAASTWNPGQIPGMWLWWVASDLTNGYTVTNWVDRIQGVVMTNGGVSLRPTNSATGVYFSGTTFLTNVAQVISSGKESFFISLQVTENTGGYEGIFGLTGPGNNIYTFDFGHFSTPSDWEYAQASSVALGYRVPVGATMDLIESYDGSSQWLYYTNGVQSMSVAAGDKPNLTMRGVANRNGQRLVGYIQELAIWTNALTTDQVTQLHTNRVAVYP